MELCLPISRFPRSRCILNPILHCFHKNRVIFTDTKFLSDFALYNLNGVVSTDFAFPKVKTHFESYSACFHKNRVIFTDTKFLSDFALYNLNGVVSTDFAFPKVQMHFESNSALLPQEPCYFH